MKKIAIVQSNYIPWKGYFDNIAQVDDFILYDDMQYTKRDWRNRNLIKTPYGLKWLTIPVNVKGKYFQKINETKVSDKSWKTAHLDLIKQSYKRAKFYKDTWGWLEEVYMNCNYQYLSEINLHFIKAINKLLNIKTEIHLSHDFELHNDRNMRLINICKDLGGTDYFSGSAAKFYIDEGLFKQNDINLHYFDYSGYQEYNQLYDGFEHKVSILDLFFNLGDKTKFYLKSNK